MSWRYHAPCLCLRCTGVEPEEYIRRPMMSLGIVSMPSRRHKTQVSMLYRETVLPLPTITSTQAYCFRACNCIRGRSRGIDIAGSHRRAAMLWWLPRNTQQQAMPLASAYFVPYVSASCASSIQTMSPTCCSSRVLGRNARSTEPVTCKPPCQTRLFQTDEMSFC